MDEAQSSKLPSEFVTKKLLHDLYWNCEMTLQKIADYIGWPYSSLYKKFRYQFNLKTKRRLWQEINTHDKDLRLSLVNKYYGMLARTSGTRDPYGEYTGLEMWSAQEFVDFCNANIDRIYHLWQRYIDSDRDLKCAVSFDRKDLSKGYTSENVRITTHGFNSWHNHLNPIVVIEKDDTVRYFSSPEEASRYYDINPNDIREVLRGGKYNRLNFDVEKVSIDDLLEHHDCSSLQEYYFQVLIW